MLEFVFDRAEKFMGKGEDARNQHFLHFLQCLKRLLPYVEIVWYGAV